MNSGNSNKNKQISATRLGLNYLSKPVTVTMFNEIESPFEIMIDIDILPSIGLTELQEQQLDWWQNGFLKIDKDKYHKEINLISIPVCAYYYNRKLSKFTVKINKHIDEQIEITVTPRIALTRNYEDFELLENVILSKGEQNAFNIRFESGHVLTGSTFYKQKYCDFLFEEWRSIDLKNYDVTLEKPTDWNEKTKPKQRVKSVENLIPSIKTKKSPLPNSLFKKVIKEPFQIIDAKTHTEWYLLCHDKANEVADYIYIEPEGRRIDLIHVKGAMSSGAREISIDAYQIVCAQAIKNLRHLNGDILYERFKNEDLTKVGQYLISNDNPKAIKYEAKDFKSFVDGLKRLQEKPVLIKIVIIFQPHVTKNFWNRVIKPKHIMYNGSNLDQNLRRAYMLSTLLIETKISCIKQGINFHVCNEK